MDAGSGSGSVKPAAAERKKPGIFGRFTQACKRFTGYLEPYDKDIYLPYRTKQHPIPQTVLVICADNELKRGIIATSEKLGAVTVANSRDEAKKLIEAQRFGCIVLDIPKGEEQAAFDWLCGFEGKMPRFDRLGIVVLADIEVLEEVQGRDTDEVCGGMIHRECFESIKNLTFGRQSLNRQIAHKLAGERSVI
jgi:hypothetical protein